jgi:hypothetical protein
LNSGQRSVHPDSTRSGRKRGDWHLAHGKFPYSKITEVLLPFIRAVELEDAYWKVAMNEMKEAASALRVILTRVRRGALRLCSWSLVDACKASRKDILLGHSTSNHGAKIPDHGRERRPRLGFTPILVGNGLAETVPDEARQGTCQRWVAAQWCASAHGQCLTGPNRRPGGRYFARRGKFPCGVKCHL